jgi:hypothetical protein
MEKSEFRQLFVRAISTALERARQRNDALAPADYKIELHGGGISGQIMDLDQAVDTMYLGPDVFYRIIDVGVKDIGNEIVIFVRISSHHPSAFDDTWNTPKGSGPFKVLEPLDGEIK